MAAAIFGSAQVHAQQHLRPVLRVRTAGARVDREHGVARVVLAREERVLLQPPELPAQRLDRGRDLARHLTVHREELDGVLVLLREALEALESPGYARVLGR